jgi:hypothetical protein
MALTKLDMYSEKYNNKVIRQADGWVCAYYENDICFLVAGPKSGTDVTEAMEPADAAKFRENGTVTLEKVPAGKYRTV